MKLTTDQLISKYYFYFVFLSLFDLIMSFADLKSMVSAGLASMSSCNYDLKSAVFGKKNMNILCIGHGGGSLPLFLASTILG